MPLTYSYFEREDDNSPSSANFTVRQQSASGTYITEPTSLVDMTNRLIDILGYTSTRVGGAKMNRALPARHPQYQWLFADSFRPRGVGTASTVLTPSPGAGSSIIPQFPLYYTYNCEISFSQRDYNVWQDADIPVAATTGVDRAGNTYSYSFAAEWMRFCKFETRPLNNFISAQQGQMRFRTKGLDAVDPNGVQYQDAPKMYMPDSSLKVRWYQVPYRYVTSENSYLRNFIGYINQVAWGDVIGSPFVANGPPTFGPYTPGQLLYHGCTPVSIYSNVVPDPGLLAYNRSNSFARALLCDLELDFTFTARQAGNTSNVPTQSNANWIAAGHNLQAWLTTRQFYLTTTFNPASPSSTSSWVPTYYSFPFSLLFSDPDCATSPTFTATGPPVGP